MSLPLARTENLTVRELTDETIVYDLANHKAHCLNRTAACVWKHCDGKTSVEQMAAILDLPHAEEVVRLALEQLSRRSLLQQAVPPMEVAARLSRRSVLRQLAAAAVALPIAVTFTSKTAAAAGVSAVGCAGKVDGTACSFSVAGATVPGCCNKGTCSACFGGCCTSDKVENSGCKTAKCTNNCLAGTATIAPAGTSCGGGKVCDGTGNCACPSGVPSCASNSDCDPVKFPAGCFNGCCQV